MEDLYKYEKELYAKGLENGFIILYFISYIYNNNGYI